MRVDELCGLDRADLDPVAAELKVRRAKGGKQRLVPLHPDCVAAALSWLALRGDGPGPLFWALDRAAAVRAGRNRGARRLTPQGVRDVCARRGA